MRLYSCGSARNCSWVVNSSLPLAVAMSAARLRRDPLVSSPGVDTRTEAMAETNFRCGMLVFPNLTQLDMTGPYEILARIRGSEVSLIWKGLDPVRTEHGLTILPTATFATALPLDLVLVPGGGGVNPLLEDPETLDFVRRAAASARYVVSVCTGALVLGAAGLLRGK